VVRSAEEAMQYLFAAMHIGPWAGWLRRGLDHYLNGHYELSVHCYLHGGELGRIRLLAFWT